jgi:hypothetical protein
MRKSGCNGHWKVRTFTTWLKLGKAYLINWKQKPSFKTFCQIVLFLVKLTVSVFVKKLLECIFKH